MALVKLLKTKRMHKVVYNIYKTLIYNIIIVLSLGDLSTVCRWLAYGR